MKARHITLSFLLVPRFFLTLLFWPLLLGLVLAAFQLLFSTAYLEVVNRKAKDIEVELKRVDDEGGFYRDLIYGAKHQPRSLQVCIWTDNVIPSNCRLGKNDVVIRVAAVQDFNYAPYFEVFSGVFERMHICSSCGSEFVVIPNNDQTITVASNFKGLLFSGLVKTALRRSLKESVVIIRHEKEERENLLGQILFKPLGLTHYVDISNINKTMILVINVGILMVTAFYLAIRSHRKVLDYFAKNGALLPLVAACGKREFYKALWIITFIRVFCFLGAAIPTTISVFMELSSEVDIGGGILSDYGLLLLWFISIACGMATLTFIASVAELKARHIVSSVMYKILTLFIFILGAIVWLSTLFVNGSVSTLVQMVTTALPVFGLCPVLLAPVVPVDSNVLAFHTILSGLLVVVLVRVNSSWFASHLEEL